MATSVNSAEDLWAALQTAKAGTVIELAPGNYGHLGINARWNHHWASFDGEVTIRSADPNKPATFSSISMLDVDNLTIDGVVVDYETPKGLTAKQIEEDKAVQVRDSTNITFRNSVFDGDVLDNPSSPRDGLPVGLGLSIRWSENVLIENNEFLEWRTAGSFLTSSDVVVRGNDVHTIRVDGFTFVAVQDFLIEDNHLHDFAAKDGLGDHRDMIQFWTAGTTTPSKDIVIRDNYLDSGDGPWTQSIFMRNEAVDGEGGAGKEMFYRNILIENNTIYNGHLHGITVGETDGLTIVNNTLLHNPDAGDGGNVSRPRINVVDDALNVRITKNIAENVNASSGAFDNLRVQNRNPDADNYYGKLFIDALSGGDSDLAELKGLAGGIVKKGGYGSSLTDRDYGPNAGPKVGSKPEPNPEPTPEPTPAPKPGSGSLPPEELEEPGQENPAPDLPGKTGFTRIDFGSGDPGPASRLFGDAAVSKGGTLALDGDGDFLAVKNAGQPEFTGAVSVAFDVRFDKAPDPSDKVLLVGKHTQFLLEMRGGEIKPGVRTADGKIDVVRAPDAPDLFDGDWHRLALSIDSEADVLRFYADGDLVAEQTDLDIELADSSRSVTFGSAGWNEAMAGEIDNIVFADAALDFDALM